MTKQLLTMMAGTALAASAQNFQQPGWSANADYRSSVAHANRPDGQTGRVYGKPFSASEVRRVVQTLADGTHLEQPSETTLFYRDAEGRMRTESRDHILIYDPIAGAVYNLHPGSKTYQKNAISDPNSSTTIAATATGTWVSSTNTTDQATGDLRVRMGSLHVNSQPVTESLGSETIEGIASNHQRVTVTIPKGAFGNDRDLKVVNERWYSDDLRVLMKSTNSDPRFGVTTYELTRIVQAAPDPTLFQVPSDYRLTEGR